MEADGYFVRPGQRTDRSLRVLILLGCGAFTRATSSAAERGAPPLAFVLLDLRCID